MNSRDIDAVALASVQDDVNPLSQPQRSNALSNKITSVLASSFTDGEFRESLHNLNEQRIQNTAEARRRLRLDAQKEVIDCNEDVVRDFGQVAEVRSFTGIHTLLGRLSMLPAIEAHRLYDSQPEPILRIHAQTRLFCAS